MRHASLAPGSRPISVLGIGGWQAGGRGPWGSGPDADDDASIAAIRRAVEAGVGWVETAASYGLGHSEEVVARALAPWRIGEDVLVFTKCGHPWDPPDRIRTDLRPESIRAECAASLERLGVERIDLYQLHHADPTVPVEESWAAMAGLVEQGTVRWAGVSNFTVDLLERCEAIRHVDCVQPELNLLRAGAAADVLAWCRAHGTAVIGYSPQASGVLAAPADRQALDTLPAEKRRGLPVSVLRTLLGDLQAVAERLGTTIGALAVAWVLDLPGVTGAICGARTPLQVDGWLPAADVRLDAAAAAAIAEALERAGVGVPRIVPQ